MLDITPITIIGTGLLGGSIGLGLRRAGYAGRIVGVGRRQATLDTAVTRGCIDQGITDVGQAASAGGLIILATPLGMFPDLLRAIAGSAPQATIITDVGSTKSWVCQQAREILPTNLSARFVGSHPMAGGETHGPGAARADLFAGLPCVMTPPDDGDPDAAAAVTELWHLLGARILTTTPAEHDRIVAGVSHVPHVLAALLFQQAAETGRLDVASTGLRDTTRVASGDPTVWTDILLTNRQAVCDQLDELTRRLVSLRASVARGDSGTINQILTDAKTSRDAWNNDHNRLRLPPENE